LDCKIGAPEDLAKLISNPEGIEIDKAIEIPQYSSEPIETAKTAPSTAHATKVKSEEPAFVVPTPTAAPKASLPDDLSSSNFMPIKALNTFTRDWMIKARVATKNMRQTQKGG
jgi:replication factor A1